MAHMALSHLGKVYDDGTRAVTDLNIDIDDGEFLVFVGPSGCGKTTALRMVAGLETISEGEVRIGDRVVNNVPPRDRDVAMVFQSYALYPHLSVRDNIGFGLQLRKMPKAEACEPRPQDTRRDEDEAGENEDTRHQCGMRASSAERSSAWRAAARCFTLSDLSWPQAAMMSRPRGVRTGEE